MKLISMREFVLNVVQTPNINEAICLEQTQDRLGKIYQYALFLSQPLTLGMFVPCDLDGNVLEEPEQKEKEGTPFHEPFNPSDDYTKYQQAKERVLFEGFEYLQEIRNSGGNYTHILKNDEIEIYEQWGGFHVYGKNEVKTIEDLVRLNLTLTQQAIKQIGG